MHRGDPPFLGPIETLAETGSPAESDCRIMPSLAIVRDLVPVSVDVGRFGEYHPNRAAAALIAV